MELIFTSIHSLPYVNYTCTFSVSSTDPSTNVSLTYSLDMICAFATLSRVYTLWNIFSLYSMWNSERAESVCMESHCDSGMWFSVKCELKERPYTIIVGGLVVSLLLFGFAMRCAEM